MLKKVFVSTLVLTITLFIWGATTQLFPWGVPSTQKLNAQQVNTLGDFQTPDLIQLQPSSLTTNQFDHQMVNKISTLATDQTFSWIITKPLSYYDVGGYFSRELITQALVALLLSLLLWQLREQEITHRLKIVFTLGLIAVIAINGAQFNWWGCTCIVCIWRKHKSCNWMVSSKLCFFQVDN